MNITDNLKRKLSETHKQKLSDKRKLMYSAGLVHPMKGRHHTDAAKIKIGRITKGKPSHLRGKTLSEATRAKMSAVRKGRRLSEEHKRAISAGKMGNFVSDEGRKNMSIAARKAWARRRNA